MSARTARTRSIVLAAMALLVAALAAVPGAPNAARATGDELSWTSFSPLAAVKLGEVADVPLQATGGIPPYTFSLVESDSLPTGLSIDGDGITGTPTQTGTSTFTLRVTDDSGATADREFDLSVVRGVRIITLETPGNDLIVLGDLASRTQAGNAASSSVIPPTPPTKGWVNIAGGSAPFTVTGVDSRTNEQYSFITDVNYDPSSRAHWAKEGDERPKVGGSGELYFRSLEDQTHSGRDGIIVLESREWCSTSLNATYTSYCSMFGPEVWSASFFADAGESLSFDWAAAGGGDDYETYAFLVRVPDSGEPGAEDHTLLAYGRGGTQEWTTASGVIPADGEYQFRFVNGSYDRTGGGLLGARMFVDPDSVKVGSTQTITFPSLGEQSTASGTPNILNLNGVVTASSGLPVALASTTSSVCTVLGMSVTLSSAGTCTLTANQGGSDLFVPAATVTRSFDVQMLSAQAEVVALVSPSSSSLGNTVTVSGGGGSGTGSFSFSLADDEACELSGDTITITAASGACAVTATRASDGTFAARSSLPTEIVIHPAVAWATVTPYTPVLGRSFALDLESIIDGGGGDRTLTIVSGSLPAGLALDSAQITGTVEDSSLVGDEFPVELRVSDAASGTVADTTFSFRPATIGQLLTTDYGSAPIFGGAFFWRGYAFQVTERTVVTHLVGGGREELGTGKRFDGALFSASGGTGPNFGSPSSILAEVTFEADTVNQAVELDEPVVLEADTWYFLAQGSVEGTVLHWYVDSLSAADLVTASSRIKLWEPLGAGSDGKGQALIWSGGNHDASNSSILNRAPSTTPAKPAIGIRYLTFDTPPSVQTGPFDDAPSRPLRGRMTGGTSGAAYILHGPSSTLGAGSALSFISSVGPDATFELTDLTGVTAATYYYAARAVNDAGASQGSITSFETRAQTISGLTAPATLTYGDEAFAVTLSATSGLPVTLQASGGACAVSGTTVTVTSAGTCTLTATQTGGWDGDDFWRQTSTSVSRTVAPRTVTLSGSITAESRTYDGTTDVVIDRSDLVLGPDILSGDTVSITSATGAFGDPEVGSDKSVELTAVVLGGSAASRYTVSLVGAPQATASILAIPLTVDAGSFTVSNKVYDGTDVATVSSSTLTLSGFASGDSMEDITWNPAGRFVDRTAGAGRTVELVGGAVLGGAKGANYTLDVTGAPTATASITPRPVTVTGASVAARPYDGTTAVTITGATLANTVAGDAVTLAGATSGVAASRDVGTRSVSTSMTLAGAAATNYTLTGQPSLSVTITPRPATVTLSGVPSRVYDGTNRVPVPAGSITVSGLVAGESIAASGTATLPFRDAGTRVLTLDPTYTPGPGTSLANYTLPTTLTGTVTITPRPVSVTGLRALGRPWDGTTTAALEGATLQGIVAGDRVSLTGTSFGTFAASAPGTHAVTAAVALTGDDARNYRLAPIAPLSATISRAPATLRITGGLTQFADGSPRNVRAAATPADAGRVAITYPGGSAPTAPGSYPIVVRLDSATHDAPELRTTLTIQPVDALLLPTPTSANGSPAPAGSTGATATSAGTPEDAEAVERRREALMSRIAVRTDGTLALPEIGPVLEADGTAPAFAPREHRVLEDGEPALARVVVIEEQRVLVETEDRSLTLELQAAITTPEGRVPLPVDTDGTLLLDRGGFVEVGGSGFLAGSTAEVWMFSEATFLGTAIVGPDGSFEGAFPVDELLAPGEHTIQLNGTGADQRVRSTSLGVRITDEPAVALAEERVTIITALADTPLGGRGPVALLLLAAALGASVMRWWIVGKRRRDDEDDTTAATSVKAPLREYSR